MNSLTNNRQALCIGSNYEPEQNVALARARLQQLLPGIRFAACRYTEPLHMTHSASFLNQVAVFDTDRPIAELRALFKAIEHEAGRLPGDKKRERVCLDIDLLYYDNNIL
ncbi:MAG: 2-amino-4-hydroxy-6-hydroxymethyldihydropteridine diphosphokinase, partial [Bacteroides sp.]